MHRDDAPVRALSLLEPYATLIAISAKKIETRSWQTKYRGPLAIHASKKLSASARSLSSVSPFCDALMNAGLLPSGCLAETAGRVLCVADLAWVLPTEVAIEQRLVREGTPEFAFGNYAPGRFAWCFENVRPVEPFPFNGTQGIFFVPDRLFRYREMEAA